jgi:hypothetical protein
MRVPHLDVVDPERIGDELGCGEKRQIRLVDRVFRRGLLEAIPETHRRDANALQHGRRNLRHIGPLPRQ